MIVPAAVVHQSEIEKGVRAAEAALKPDVVRIRYDIGEDWSGQWAIFFRVVLSDFGWFCPTMPPNTALGKLQRVLWGVWLSD
jgi:hypothetical protein